MTVGDIRFVGYRFDEGMVAEPFVYAADGVSQELYDFSEGLARVLPILSDNGEDLTEAGTCVIEFRRLVMRARRAGTSKWVAPIRTFIEKRFRRTRRQWNHALILSPFPPEFENARSLRRGDAALDRRRRATVRLYERALAVRLAASESADRLWMGRLL